MSQECLLMAAMAQHGVLAVRGQALCLPGCVDLHYLEFSYLFSKPSITIADVQMGKQFSPCTLLYCL